MTEFIVDISSWQEGIDIERIARERFAACIIKATEGLSYKNPYFVDWAIRARNSGMIPGAYHWLHNGNGTAEAEYFYAAVRRVGGPAGMLCALDVEEVITDPPTYQTVYDFVRRWEWLTAGHPLILYTGDWWWPDDWPGAALTPYLWDSQYVGGNDYASNLYQNVPQHFWNGYGGWPKATLLQYSSSAIVSNMTKVDVSAFEGTRSQLLTLTGKVDEDVNLGDNVECRDWWNLRNGATLNKSVALLLGQTGDAAEYAYWRTVDVLSTVRTMQADLKALTSLVAALAAGGTSLDTTAVLKAIADSREAFMTELDEVRDQRIAELQAALTAAQQNG